jgi:hypothetical protein
MPTYKPSSSEASSRAPGVGGLPLYEWIRLPRTGTRCPVCGLSRSTLNRLILPNAANGHNPPVRSTVLKQRYAVRGVRLINRASLNDFLESQGQVVAATENTDLAHE